MIVVYVRDNYFKYIYIKLLDSLLLCYIKEFQSDEKK